MNNHRFVAYFTQKGVWRSCDVKEIGVFGTEQAAMRAGQRHAAQTAPGDLPAAGRLVWKRVPQGGLAAPTPFGRYDIREAAAG